MSVTRKQVREVFREFRVPGELYRGYQLIKTFDKTPDGWDVCWRIPGYCLQFAARQEARAWVDRECQAKSFIEDLRKDN